MSIGSSIDNEDRICKINFLMECQNIVGSKKSTPQYSKVQLRIFLFMLECAFQFLYDTQLLRYNHINEVSSYAIDCNFFSIEFQYGYIKLFNRNDNFLMICANILSDYNFRFRCV